MSAPPLEIPIFSPAAITKARSAARIELNAQDSYSAGGLTPSEAELAAAVVTASPTVPVRVMIRLRGAPADGGSDFLYDEAELHSMEEAIRRFRAGGKLDSRRGDGFVFGCLRVKSGAAAAEEEEEERRVMVVDVEWNRRLVEAAGPLVCVFHRAFDDVVASGGWEAALDDVVACGFGGLLTSGGPGNAPDNVEVVGRIIEAARGRLEVIVGGGVRSTRLDGLVERIRSCRGATSVVFHSSCLGSGGGHEEIDEDEARAVVDKLRLLYGGE